jgi:MoxR-like ATPase
MSKAALHAKAQAVIDDVASVCIDREEEAHLLMLCFVSRNNCFLVGEPGVAKSMVVEEVTKRIEGAPFFKYLMTRFSEPNEVFGPIDIAEYEKGRTVRVPDGMLQEAKIAVLDEIFKANSAILNSLLTAANEHRISVGGKWVNIPLTTLVGASNELPQGEDLGALYDRLLARIRVRGLADEGSLTRLCRAPRTPPKPKATMTLVELERAQAEVDAVTITDDTLEAYLTIRHKLASVRPGEKLDATQEPAQETETKEAKDRPRCLKPSDRRFKATLSLVQAAAWLAGRDQTLTEDLSVAAHCFWDRPKHAPTVASVVCEIAVPGLGEVMGHLDRAADAHEAALAVFARSGLDKAFTEQTAKIAKSRAAIEKVERIAGASCHPKIKAAARKVQMFSDDVAKVTDPRRARKV